MSGLKGFWDKITGTTRNITDQEKQTLIGNNVLREILLSAGTNTLSWFLHDTVEGRQFRNRMILLTVRRFGFFIWILIFLVGYAVIDLTKKAFTK